jgi:glycine cleavage system aminomethyltransferase T
MGIYIEDAMSRVPETLTVGAKKFFCGPESFTPDGNPIIGESPELQNYFVAAGLNSIGILTGGGIGKLMARWIRDKHPPIDVDVTGINIDRFHKYQRNPKYRADRVGEVLGETYKVNFPDHNFKTCRNVKRSVLHHRLQEMNAHFRNVSGWESPSWYAPAGIEPVIDEEHFGRQSFFKFWESEHLACRENVVIFDMSFMSKFLVQGNDAGIFLNHLSTANVDGDYGKITYTQWLNEQGYMEADLTVTKLDDDKFLVVATDTMHNHVFTHMKKRLTTNDHVFVNDVTGSFAQLNIQGPNSRNLLQSITSFDLNNFPFRSAAEIDIGFGRAICTRITYVGELGYELFIPTEFALHVYDTIVTAGEKFELKHGGLRALGSLRMEKGYRDYGHDMDNTDTLLECGLGFTCDFEKSGGFIGIEKVLSQKQLSLEEGGLKKRMAQVLLEDPHPLLHHGEVVYRDGEMFSDIRSASYGHSLGGAVGLTMLEAPEPINKSFITSGRWEVAIGNDLYPCKISLAPMYDPKNKKVKVT